MLLAALLLALALWPAPAGAAGWRRPVDAPVAGRFTYSARDPFAAGRRRGVDFAAARGSPVRAPCGGRVAYAGPVPGRGLGVTLRCGGLTATLLGLSSVAVRRGELATPGARVGSASGSGPLRLGARLTGHRFAYRDPLTLIGGPHVARPRPPAPLRGARAPRRGPPALPDPPAPSPVAVPRARAPAAGHARVPFAAWLGAALLAATLTAGIALPRLRRRTRATAAAARRA